MQGGGFPAASAAAREPDGQWQSGVERHGRECDRCSGAALNDRILELWSTPHGVIKAAQAAGRELEGCRRG